MTQSARKIDARFEGAAKAFLAALWLWAFALLLPCFEQPETAAPRGAGVALSLSVVASLVLLIPAAVLAAIALWRLPRKLAFAAPIAAVALLFLIVSPLHAARPD